MSNTNENKKEKSKEAFNSFWKKAQSMGKQAAEGAKNLAEQTQQYIHDQQAKKYDPVTLEEYKSKSFKMPSVITIVDDSANSNFVSCEDAIGWIEKHDDVDVLHMYAYFIKKSGINFVPAPQCDNVYCADNFTAKRYINSNCVFSKATEEKLAELENIAYLLGAKKCSIEVVESDTTVNSQSGAIGVKKQLGIEVSATNKLGKMQSGKIVANFSGHSDPKAPTLKWFACDENIKRLIDVRCADVNSIQYKVIEIKGSSTATMSKKIACAIDKVLDIKGKLSMESQTMREHSNVLVFEVEF
jgi:hypothetical protein